MRPARRHRVVSAALAVVIVLLGWRGVEVVQLRRSVDRYRDHWSTPQGEPGGLVYVALGDSTAQGIGASRPDRGYVGVLAERLRASTGRPVQVVNLSRSGARVADVVDEQLPRLAGLSPDVVTVAVGANDVKRYDRSRFRRDVDALVAALPPGTFVADVPWFMHGAIGRSSHEAAAYVAASAAARALPVARLYQATRERGWGAMLTDFAADWFHPDDRGYRVWADAFWTVMEPAVAGSPG
ncbi:MAG: SGNH/GDSL hydrolase family protein [Acidimicrobiia bacterium]